MSPLPVMANLYLPTFLLLICLSSFILLLLALLPSATPSFPLESSSNPSLWSSPSCSPGQSWAVRLHPGFHHEEEDGEHGTGHLDVIANKVEYFINTFANKTKHFLFNLTQGFLIFSNCLASCGTGLCVYVFVNFST